MTEKTSKQPQEEWLARIAVALEHLAGVAPPPSLPANTHALVWHTKPDRWQAVDTSATLPLSLLCGIATQADILLKNSQQFAKGLPANHALLWGARGVGKSSLIKSVCAAINHETKNDTEKLTLIEIYRHDIASLPRLLAGLAPHSDRHFIIFCDDLTFGTDGNEDRGGGENTSSYKSLKTILEGGLLTTPSHILFYATSNRRHLMGRTMHDRHDGQNSKPVADSPNQSTISGRETIDERVSLSDRFGLWLGFYAIDQETYLTMIEKYARAIGLVKDRQALIALQKSALEWARTRGDMSGRVAYQFIVDAAGKAGLPLKFKL